MPLRKGAIDVHRLVYGDCVVFDGSCDPGFFKIGANAGCLSVSAAGFKRLFGKVDHILGTGRDRDSFTNESTQGSIVLIGRDGDRILNVCVSCLSTLDVFQ